MDVVDIITLTVLLHRYIVWR